MFNKIRNCILYSVIASIIFIAVSISAARILLPDVQSYRSYVEEQLAGILDHPVKIGDLNALISGITPIVIFHDVKLMSDHSDKVLLEIKKIKIGFSIWRSIKQQKIVPSIYTIDGATLAIIRQKDGKILIQGIDVARIGDVLAEQDTAANTELSEWLFKRSSVVIQNSSIIWHDKKRLTKPTRFKDVTLRLKNNRNRHQFNGEFILSNDINNPKRMELALDVYGDMLDPVKWVGKFYAKGTNIEAAEWGFKPVIMDVMVEHGLLDFNLWGDWIAGELNKIEANVSARDVVIKRLKNNAIANIPLLSGLFKWDKDFKDWNFSIDSLKLTTKKGAWPETKVSVSSKFNDVDKSTTVETEVDYCRIEDVRDLLLKSGYVENKILKYLQFASPSGELKKIQHKIKKQENKEDEFFLSAIVNNLSLIAYEQIPSLKKISGEIFSNHNSGVFVVKANNAELDFRRFLPKTIRLDSIKGNIEWFRNEDAWVFYSQELIAKNKDASIDVSFNLNISDADQSTYLDLQSTIIKAKVSEIKNYLPNEILVGDFKKWINSAFESGTIENAGVIFSGRLNDFPFHKNTGVFKAYLPASNVVLNYKVGWPIMQLDKIDAFFTGTSLDVSVKQARVLKSKASNFSINISNFNKPRLKTKVYIKSNLDDVAQYSSTTFLKNTRDFIKSSSFSGSTNIDLYMDLPLSSEAEDIFPLNIKAKVFLINASVSTAKNKLYVNKINGTVDLTKNSATANGIDAIIMGGKSKVDIFTSHQYGGHPIRFVMQGNIDVAQTMKRFKLAGYDKVKGRTDWQGVFTLKYKQDSITKNPIFQATADMRDVIIDLPPPMSKKTKNIVPVYLTVENVSKNEMLLSLIYGENMSYALDMDLSIENNALLRRGEFRFKPGVAKLPDDEILLLTGSLKDFSLGDWLAALDATSIKSKKSFFAVPVTVKMDYLHVAKAKNRKPRKPSDPRRLPTFEGEIKKFVYDTFPYGKATFKTLNENGGMRLENFTIISPYVKAEGKGYWHYKPNKQWTEVSMTVDSDNYGDFLTSLGFSSIIENGVAAFSGDFNWTGGFGDFRWETLNGLVTMDITNGVFTKVDPGAGRLLGLLSIESLPGMLLSGDAFNKGFNFDRIVGVYEILDGNAYSDDVSISGPVANILVTGRTGIVARDFDHYLTVVPNVSGALPLSSGLLFGPQIGAVVYFFKKLFGSGIDESSKRIYHLTGTWENPVSTRIDKNEDKPKDEPDVDEPDVDESDDDV